MARGKVLHLRDQTYAVMRYELGPVDVKALGTIKGNSPKLDHPVRRNPFDYRADYINEPSWGVSFGMQRFVTQTHN